MACEWSNRGISGVRITINAPKKHFISISSVGSTTWLVSHFFLWSWSHLPGPYLGHTPELCHHHSTLPTLYLIQLHMTRHLPSLRRITPELSPPQHFPLPVTTTTVSRCVLRGRVCDWTVWWWRSGASWAASGAPTWPP